MLLIKLFGRKMKYQSPSPISDALQTLYSAQNILAEAFPEWPFSLDGKLIGDIGEAIVSTVFGLERLPEGEKTHDMRAPDGRLVQVKATQKGPNWKGVGLGLTKQSFEHLIVIEFDTDGSYEVLYNGPGNIIDEAREHKSSPSLSRKQLRDCQLKVIESQKLQQPNKRMESNP